MLPAVGSKVDAAASTTLLALVASSLLGHMDYILTFIYGGKSNSDIKEYSNIELRRPENDKEFLYNYL